MRRPFFRSFPSFVSSSLPPPPTNILFLPFPPLSFFCACEHTHRRHLTHKAATLASGAQHRLYVPTLSLPPPFVSHQAPSGGVSAANGTWLYTSPPNLTSLTLKADTNFCINVEAWVRRASPRSPWLFFHVEVQRRPPPPSPSPQGTSPGDVIWITECHPEETKHMENREWCAGVLTSALPPLCPHRR